MRVALLTTSWPRFDGDPSGHFVQAEARVLTRCGEEVEVIAGDGEAFAWPGVAARIAEAPLRSVGAAAWVARARRRVQEGGFDRLVAHWAVPCAWPIATGPGAPLDVVSHGGDVRLLARLPAPLRAALVGAIARRARAWRFVSSGLREALVAGLPRDLGRRVEAIAHVAPCAIDLEAPSAAEVEAKRARVGAPFAVAVARLVDDKRVDLAIASAAARSLPLVVVGDGPERAALERAAAAAGARVLFAGRTPRPEALAWIAASVELIQASRAEGLSTVVREAEGLGVPVRVLE